MKAVTDQWEQLKGLLGSSAQPICPIDVAPGEQEIARVPAQGNPGSLSEVAGDLILTNTRLIFAPLMLHGMAEAREWLCIKGSAEAYAIEDAVTVEVFSTEDATEGARAFVEKRTAVWRGR